MGFGTEVLFMAALGGLLLGPKRLHTVLGHIARTKAQFQKASRNLKSQLEEELVPGVAPAKPIPPEVAGDQ